MIRKKKLYVKPRKSYEKARILEENKLLQKYALKNKREIWKTLAKVNYFRHRAMDLVKKSREEQEVFFKKLNNLGLKVKSVADILALKVENILERRLPSIIFRKGYSKTAKEARQLVSHRKILVNGRIVDVPSYIVSVAEENNIFLKQRKKEQTKMPEKENKDELSIQNREA